jgi:hypothetical protein
MELNEIIWKKYYASSNDNYIPCVSLSTARIFSLKLTTFQTYHNKFMDQCINGTKEFWRANFVRFYLNKYMETLLNIWIDGCNWKRHNLLEKNKQEKISCKS